jgi:hypothetical protein
MKPLNKRSNVEKAKLLFDLFPQEIPNFILFAKQITQAINDDPENLKNKAIDQIHTTEFWRNLASNANKKLDEYGDKLANRSRLFSVELFDDYNSIYACYCLHQYMISQKYKDRKFRTAVMLLFF